MGLQEAHIVTVFFLLLTPSCHNSRHCQIPGKDRNFFFFFVNSLYFSCLYSILSLTLRVKTVGLFCSGKCLCMSCLACIVDDELALGPLAVELSFVPWLSSISPGSGSSIAIAFPSVVCPVAAGRFSQSLAPSQDTHQQWRWTIGFFEFCF